MEHVNIYNPFSKEQIKNRILMYNNNYITKLKDCLKEKIYNLNGNASSELLYLLATSAPTDIKGYNALNLSPIISGYKNNRDKPLLLNYHILYNFYGHQPASISPIIDKFITGTFEDTIAYNINCDISNTLLGNLNQLNTKNLSKNYSYLISKIKDNKLELFNNTIIYLKEGLISEWMGPDKKYNYRDHIISKEDENLLSEKLPIDKFPEKSFLGKYYIYKNITKHIINNDNQNKYIPDNSTDEVYLFSELKDYKLIVEPYYPNQEHQNSNTSKIGGRRRTIRKNNKKLKMTSKNNKKLKMTSKNKKHKTRNSRRLKK
jgi:hypothetical protein